MEDSILKEISILTHRDIRVVKLICEHPFLFAKHKIEDPNEDRAVMIMHFGKFVCKHNVTKDMKRYNTINLSVQKAIAKGR